MMISIGYLRFTDAVQRASFSVRQRAASVLAWRALRNFAAVVPWQSVGTNAAMRESLWCEVEKLCNVAGRKFGVPGEMVEEACPEVSLLKVLMTERLKPQPIVMPMTFVGIHKS